MIRHEVLDMIFALEPGDTFTIREMAQGLNVSNESVRLAAENFTEQGLLEKNDKGRFTVYMVKHRACDSFAWDMA